MPEGPRWFDPVLFFVYRRRRRDFRDAINILRRARAHVSYGAVGCGRACGQVKDRRASVEMVPSQARRIGCPES